GSYQLAPLFGHLERWRDERLRRGRTQTDHDARLQDRELRIEPEAAGLDLAPSGLLVQAPLAGLAPLEVLHRVGHVHRAPVDARGLERLVEHSTRGTDEGTTCDVFFVARLLADEHDFGRALSLTENGLRRVLPKAAGAAMCRRFAVFGKDPELGQIGVLVSRLVVRRRERVVFSGCLIVTDAEPMSH